MNTAENDALALFRQLTETVRRGMSPSEHPSAPPRQRPTTVERVIGQGLAEMNALLREIAGALRHSPRAPSAPAKLLSQRKAARMLGIDRNTTLHDLIASGQLRTVLVNGLVKVPLVEVERLGREGFDTTLSPKSRSRVAGNVYEPSAAEKIRALKL